VADGDEIWLVAGGEPGADRFGQLVQRLRKGQQLSVDEVAEQAGLSVATIRAIEQARRAPSKESGVRLLQVLLPEGALSKGEGSSLGTGQNPLDYSFVHPLSGTRVLLEFGAKTAGDNRRWSSDKPLAGESKIEAAVRELMSDPERRAKWLRETKSAFALLDAAAADAKSRAARPASDAAFGRIMRRLVTANEFRLARIEVLLDVWDRVDSDTANDLERNLAAQATALLDGYQQFPEDVDDAPPLTD
jgi:transcriptional regulator with XRE-family HTH domain